MNLQEFLSTITRRWWVILATVAVALSGALAYAHQQPRIYQASATVLAHPSGKVSRAVDINSDVGMLTYGTLSETFSALAESRSFLDQAGQKLGVSRATVAQYTTKSATLPGTAVLEVSVTGPDPTLAAHLANTLIARVGAATADYFHVITLTRLDQATVPQQPIQPRPAHDALYAVLAGLIVGYIIALLSLNVPRPVGPAVPVSPAQQAIADARPLRVDDADLLRVGTR
jgi:polysaccharide biosynthesis transport protein